MLDWTVLDNRYGNHRTQFLVRAGGRYDRNNIDTGVGGAEFGVGLRFASPTFRALGDGRVFIPRGSSYREWGVRTMIEVRSRDERIALQVSPAYGNADNGIQQLWERGAADQLETTPVGGRVNALLRYSPPGLNASPYWRVNVRNGQYENFAGFGYRLSNQFNVQSEATRRCGETGWSLRGQWRH